MKLLFEEFTEVFYICFGGLFLYIYTMIIFGGIQELYVVVEKSICYRTLNIVHGKR